MRSSVVVAGVALACVMHGAAAAADATDPKFLAPLVFKAPQQPPAYDWSGFYAGVHAGYGIGHATSTLSDPLPSVQDNAFSSMYGGFQAGYNYVLPSHLMLGAEADISFPNFFENGAIFTAATPAGTAVTDWIDYIATLRGRVGYAFDHWLIYGTGGFAWSQARFGETPGVASAEDKMLLTRTGWSLGLGVEYAIAPAWTARIEYLYDRFGGLASIFPSGDAYGSAFNIQMLRIGLNRKLGVPDDEQSAESSRDKWGSDGWGWSAWPIARDSFNVHGQFTFIEQGYPTFRSPYMGPNSLSGYNQAQNTASATAFIGIRPWNGTELYINPEFTQGEGLSQTFGVAGFPNTDAQKASFPFPRFNLARVYLQQTIGLGGEQEELEDGPNQLAGKVDVSRLTLRAGEFAVTDFFDNNAYAHDGRTQFMNWNLYCCGAYDWTMNQIGYTWGAMADFNQKSWAFRAGYFLEPTTSNIDNFDARFPHGQYIAEFELRYALADEPGKLRLMGWLNHANMGSYAEALAEPTTLATYPDITLARQVRNNYGIGANLEQAITSDLGLFARASWSPGEDEIMGWTDVDWSVSAGIALNGTSWGRPNDTIGVAGIIDGLSAVARAFFAAGGSGILIGDGALNYRPEQILETYYLYRLNSWSSLTFDYQFINNPAYNADRGPVHLLAGRLHAEF